MKRKNFAEVLKNGKINYQDEYERLYVLFYGDTEGVPLQRTIRKCCEEFFLKYPFRGTCLTLDDFDETYGFDFECYPNQIFLEDLINFCEYTYNLVKYLDEYVLNLKSGESMISLLMHQVSMIVEKIGYMSSEDDGVTIFVPKVSEAIAVSEIIEGELSYKIIEYNHHLMHGDLSKKKQILLLLASQLESRREEMKRVDKNLTDNIFFMFNNFELRHNNKDPQSKYYKEYVAKMPASRLEELYDDTYQMCLLAFLEMDNVERSKRIDREKRKV